MGTFLSGLLTTLINSLGLGVVVPFIEQELLSLATTGGESAAERLITIPQASLKTLCSKTGADFTTAEAMQAIATQAEAAFIIYVGTKQTAAAVPALVPVPTPAATTLAPAEITDQPDLPPDLRVESSSTPPA